MSRRDQIIMSFLIGGLLGALALYGLILFYGWTWSQ